ncbi:MAG: hypothetical protein A2033_15930 [Bacteroidetes bacterium GWA2_31_9]|nr:MAG: hypothetical protein A2033_15930 [Bacteroidetes bacterium GWA2_31_9]
MQKHHIKAFVGVDKGKINVGLSLVEFKENNITIIYSPALDLSGYGNNTDEARQSFEVSLREFLKYTTSKSTLNEVLMNLGWTINGSSTKPKYRPPLDTELISKNETYSEIINKKNYSVSRQYVDLEING